MAGLADTAAIQRQLQIKTGVVKRCVLTSPAPTFGKYLTDIFVLCCVWGVRLAKEESSYLTEAKEQEARIQKFVDDGRDVYDVKQQVRPFPSPSAATIRCTT